MVTDTEVKTQRADSPTVRFFRDWLASTADDILATHSEITALINVIDNRAHTIERLCDALRPVENLWNELERQQQLPSKKQGMLGVIEEFANYHLVGFSSQIAKLLREIDQN